MGLGSVCTADPTGAGVLHETQGCDGTASGDTGHVVFLLFDVTSLTVVKSQKSSTNETTVTST